MEKKVGKTAEPPAYLKFASNPTKAWSVAKLSQVFQDAQLVTKNEPKPEGHVRVVCISDTHGLTNRGGPLANLPSGDILIHAGDFSNVGKLKEVQAFNEYLGTLSHPHKVVIAGNHDIGFHEDTSKRLHCNCFVPAAELKAALKNCIYLEDSAVEVLGLRIYGSPWTPVFCDWAFLKQRGGAINQVWEKIPENIDILVTHGPPLGRGDLCFPDKNRAGCANLLNIVQNYVKPRFHVYGHIHEGNMEMCVVFLAGYVKHSLGIINWWQDIYRDPYNKPCMKNLPTADLGEPCREQLRRESRKGPTLIYRNKITGSHEPGFKF